MKVIAAICADFATSALGTRSRLKDDLLGETVLRRTLKQILKAQRIASVHLLVDVAQHEHACRAAEALAIKVETHQAGDVPWRSLMASARKWSADAWRGGLCGATVFDESLHPWLLEALGRREGATGVVDVPAAAPLLDPALLDEMIEHFEKVHDKVRLSFTQSAPGLSAAIYATELLGDLSKAPQPMGQTMMYHPASPQRDMIMLPCFYPPEAEVRRAWGRCIADTDSAVTRITAVLRESSPATSFEAGVGPASSRSDSLILSGYGTTPDVMTVSRWLTAHHLEPVPEFPAEVEIELTTEDPLSQTTLRPRGDAVGHRGPMAADVFDRLIDELATRDDTRIVLGGFGDPLRHPDWPRFVQRCRDAGILGVCIRTPAVNLDNQAIGHLLDIHVDVINVLLDAATAETYRAVHRADHHDRVLANIDRLLTARQGRGQTQPLIVCEMIKTQRTMNEMERFHDHWMGKTGAAVLVGPSTYAGQWPDLAVMPMTPPTRFPCERIFTRAMVLADGVVTLCDQDCRGQHAVGTMASGSLSAIWQGKAITEARQAHLTARYETLPLCPACQEWHRP